MAPKSQRRLRRRERIEGIRFDDGLFVKEHFVHVLKKGCRVLAEIGEGRRVYFLFFVFS